MKYFKDNRERILPWVKDWSSSQDHIRNRQDIKGLSYTDWFFCHPSAYLFFNWGLNIQAIVLFAIAAPILFYLGYMFLSFLLGALLILNAVQLGRKVGNRKLFKNLTFYDLWMRDFIKLDDPNVKVKNKLGNRLR